MNYSWTKQQIPEMETARKSKQYGWKTLWRMGMVLEDKPAYYYKHCSSENRWGNENPMEKLVNVAG